MMHLRILSLVAVTTLGCGEGGTASEGETSPSSTDETGTGGTDTDEPPDEPPDDMMPEGPKLSFTDELDLLPITVTDKGHVASTAAPASGGIPFPRGVLNADDVERLGLADSEGYGVLAFSPTVLGTWPDGSVKWLLLDFPTSIESDETRTYTLGLLEEPLEPEGIVVTEEADAFVVDTGAIQVVISKTSFSFLEGVWVDADGNDQYTDDEQVTGPGEMFIDLDDQAPGEPDSGVYDYPGEWSLGIEGGNWLRPSQSDSSTRYRASDSEYAVELFRSNPAHTVFKITGWHRQDGGSRDFGKYSLYVHFYAGKGVVSAQHTWIMTGDPNNNFVRRMAIELPLVSGAESLDYAFGGAFETEGSPITHDPADPPYIPIIPGPAEVISGSVSASGEAALASIGPEKYYHDVPLGAQPAVEYSLLVDDEEVDSGQSAAGWGDVSDGQFGVAMGVRDFWREHPKEVQYSGGKMGVYIWPDHGDSTLDMRRRYDEIRGTVGEGWGAAARREFVAPGSAVGVAKTTELFFDFHSGDHGGVDDRFRRFQEPLRPFISGEHNVTTGVFGPMLAYDFDARPQIENYLDIMMARIINSQAEYGWVGMYDRGDYLPEFEKQDWELEIPSNPDLYSNWGYAGWLQENYRFGQWLLVQYYRSGRYELFRAAETWLAHARDVDCVFWDSPDDGPMPQDNGGSRRLGGGHRHDQQHWGTYMVSYGIPSIAVVHHYYMTGDGRDLDAMVDYVGWLSNDGSFYENYGEYSILYMAEALGDDEAIAWATAHEETPQSAFGRATYDSGMGLMMRDIHTGGETQVRERLRVWADLDEATAGYLKAYLASVEGVTEYDERIQTDWDAAFPADAIDSWRYEDWARIPADFRDAFSADIMPEGPWQFPIRTLENIQFDGPGGMGNDLGRHSTQMALIWSMPHVDAE